MGALVGVGFDHAAVGLADGAHGAAEGDRAEDLLVVEGLAGGSLAAGEAGGGLEEVFGCGAEALEGLLESRRVRGGALLLGEGDRDRGEKERDGEASGHRRRLPDSRKRLLWAW